MGMRPFGTPRRHAARSPGTGQDARVATRVAWAVLLLVLTPIPATAQYMALTAPAPTGRPPVAAARPAPPPRPDSPVAGGSLPNQRTGPARSRVVRDICIGCDR